jgi:NADH dehydrogenase FAD-containing subunit
MRVVYKTGFIPILHKKHDIYGDQKNGGQAEDRYHRRGLWRHRPDQKTHIGEIEYDYLVIATGANTNFFGNEEIEHFTMPMKNIGEALNIRSFMLQNLEKAVIEKDYNEREALLTFVVVGGGPTGVELSGALAELRNHILCKAAN